MKCNYLSSINLILVKNFVYDILDTVDIEYSIHLLYYLYIGNPLHLQNLISIYRITNLTIKDRTILILNICLSFLSILSVQ